MTRRLANLVRLRRLETDAARRDLAQALAEEGAILARDSALAAEVASVRAAGDVPDREILAAWLARRGAERADLAESLRVAAGRTAAVRAGLTGRRMAETAADEAFAAARAAAARLDQGRSQVGLEDAARFRQCDENETDHWADWACWEG